MMRNKVLIFVDYYLPGFKAGGPIKSVENFIKSIGENFEIYLITRNHDWGESTTYSSIESDKWIKFNGTNCYYISRENLEQKQIISLIKELVPDFIYLNSFFSHFSRIVLKFNKKENFTGRIILAPRGELQNEALKIKFYKKKLYVFITKLLRLTKNIYWHSTSNRETISIKKIFGDDNSVVRMNNIPEEYKGEWKSLKKEKNLVKLVFISRIDKKKNLHFLPEIFKSIKCGNLSLDIYGLSQDPNYLSALKKKFNKLPKNIKVQCKGEISRKEVFNTLTNYHFFILPTYGENFGHAIFEALQVGKPVIISDQTPWQDLEIKKSGWSVSLDDENKWIRIIEYCLNMNQKDYDDYSKSTWNFAKDYMDEVNLKDGINELFN